MNEATVIHEDIPSLVKKQAELATFSKRFKKRNKHSCCKGKRKGKEEKGPSLLDFPELHV
jgi:hypothetical protein